MITARGFWLLVTVLVLLGLAIASGASALILIALTLLSWFLIQWWRFQSSLRRLDASLQVERTLRSLSGEVRSLWAGQGARVQVTLTSAQFMPFVLMRDRLPALARLRSGSLQASGAVGRQEGIELEYEIECPAPGPLRFEGLALQCADVQGFFTATLFVRQPRVYRVLPRLASEPVHPTFVKRNNVLPLLGSHYHARPGSGSELLDLRDYFPGDPPKLIAWKASARRDRLMTKEFESEVPVRCTLFVDTSSAVRLGPVGATALSRLVEIAAAVQQACASDRDLVGLCLFDETGVTRLLRPARGRRHWLELLDALTDAAGLLPESPGARLADLLPHGYALAQDVYPDLLRRDVNSVPFFGPFFYRRPEESRRKSLLARLTRPLVLVLLLSPLLLWAWVGWRLRPSLRRRYRWHKQIAAILAARYRLGAGGVARLLEDESACVRHLQRFLAEHQVVTPQRLYGQDGLYLFRSPGKTAALSQALLKAVSRAKDNELFVLCADLLDAGPELDRLRQAVLVALARHHQVMIVCPWPAGVPLPSDDADDLPAASDVATLVLQASTLQLQQSFAHVQQTFRRFGVPVLCAADKETVERILARLQRLRVRERGGR